MKTCKCGLSLDGLPGISKIVCLEEVESTQAVARELAEEGSAERTVVLAECQTAGKGQPGKDWEAAEGGIYLTLLLKPESDLKFLPDLGVLAGKVVGETLTGLYGIKTRIKKPNDVYAWHPRRRKWLKIAGILTESSSSGGETSWLLLGMGVNLNNTLKLDTAVSVKALQGADVKREDFLGKFFELFWVRYSEWEYSSRARS